jgi:hypothetical protein
MKSLRVLAGLTVGAFVLAASYAAAVRDNSFTWSSDSESGRMVRHTVNGDRGEFVLRDDERLIKAEWRGDFELNDEGNGIASLDRRLEIELEQDGVEERLRFDREGRGFEKTYWKNGEEQPEGAETDAAASALFLKFLRASGLMAEERVKALINAGGVEAVLNEFDYLEGDHAVRRYAVALTEEATLSREEIATLVVELERVESDHDMRLALSALLEHQTIPADLFPALLQAAENVESDHDTRLLVEAFAENDLTGDAMDLALGLIAHIESDHDVRKAAEALLESASLTNPQAAQLLAAAANQIESDHDMRLILSETAEKILDDPAIAEAWFKGFDILESDHDRRLSISEAADLSGAEPEIWLALIDKTRAIDSDHDKRLALETISQHVMGDESLMEAYRSAAKGIDSERDRELALEAIGDETGD